MQWHSITCKCYCSRHFDYHLFVSLFQGWQFLRKCPVHFAAILGSVPEADRPDLDCYLSLLELSYRCHLAEAVALQSRVFY